MAKKLKKPGKKQSKPHWDYHEVIDFIENKYNIVTRGYIPKSGFTPEQLKKHADTNRGGDGIPYLDFWHYLVAQNEVHNGCFIYLNLLGDYKEGQADDDGDWDGDSKYRPRWVREIQKMIYDEFKPKHGEMKCWVEW
jgi:hypothetical protein